jgi:hypothetical protein
VFHKLPFFFDTFKISAGLGGQFNYFSACCLTIAVQCAVTAKGENKDVGTALNSFHKVSWNFCATVHSLI